MDKIKTYVINLPKDQKRREGILHETGQFPNLDVEMVEAVYGKDLTDLEKERLFDNKKYNQFYGRRTLLPGEIGCTLSHRECYKRLLNSDRQYALILEDDIHILVDFSDKDLWSTVEKIMNIEKPLVLLLYANINYTGKEKFFYKNYTLYSVYNAMGATAYIVNKNAACLMLKKERPYWVADDWFRFRQWGVNILCIYPSAIALQSDKFSSSIIEEKRSVSKRWLPRSVIEWRLAYEKIVFVVLKKLKIVKHLQG